MTFFFYLYMMGNWFQKKNACVKHMALPFCLCKILQRTRTKCNTTHYWPFLNPNKKLPNYFEPGWQQLCKVTKGLRWNACIHGMNVWIAYYTELNLQICNYVQKRPICRENSKYEFDEKILCPFLPSPKGYQLLPLFFEPYYWISK